MKTESSSSSSQCSSWMRKELGVLIAYAVAFYSFVILRSIRLSQDHQQRLYGLRPGWLSLSLHSPLNEDLSDAQWRNFRSNLPILTLVFALFAAIANLLRNLLSLKAKGMALVWLLISFPYLSYLHAACVIFILSIASLNFLLVKIFARTNYFPFFLWLFNLFFLLCNRVYEGYSFSLFGQQWSFLDNFRGTFRWHICFNFVVLRMISFGYDYHWAQQHSRFDQKKHLQRCHICKSGQTCYQFLQERSVQDDKFSFAIYLSYLLYAPLYIAGPIISFNAFALQLDIPQANCTAQGVLWYGLRWIFGFFLMELLTHLFHYNAFAISGLWKLLSPMDIFILGYGIGTWLGPTLCWFVGETVSDPAYLEDGFDSGSVLNFMWLKFFLIWRYFRFWSLICGIEAPENMPRCINNCYNLESFWKNWHASYNKWLVRYMYIPLGGSQRKLLNIWVIFTFVAIWHDLEWKLLSWAWLTCLFFIPEMVVKSAAKKLEVESAMGNFLFRELSAVAGAITITCLMVANLVGYVIGPSGINWLISQFLTAEGLPVLGGMFVSFYVGTKLMFHIDNAKHRKLSER